STNSLFCKCKDFLIPFLGASMVNEAGNDWIRIGNSTLSGNLIRTDSPKKITIENIMTKLPHFMIHEGVLPNISVASSERNPLGNFFDVPLPLPGVEIFFNSPIFLLLDT